ncbi:MAG: ice-binding family protein, partial [Bacteroidota bacterium]
SMTGFPPGIVNGTIHINDTESAKARIDLLNAYNFAKGKPPGVTISGGADVGALYPLGIPPGTYTSGSTMLISTDLVLDGGGNANAVWVFQIGSSLTTGANVTLTGSAQAKNVFWVPTEDATIGVGTIFNGTIVSGRDVTAVTGATINGRILAGAITAGTIALQTATVNVPLP